MEVRTNGDPRRLGREAAELSGATWPEQLATVSMRPAASTLTRADRGLGRSWSGIS
jgi:hypothetical protein